MPAADVRWVDYIHLNMPVGAEDRARRFYGGLLGLEEIPTPANPASHRGVWFRCGRARLHLGAEPEWPSRPAVPVVPVEDLPRVLDALHAAGCAAQMDIEARRSFARAVAVDPFGNRIELIQTVLPRA